MTTLHIEVGRHSGTTIENIVRGLEMAGVMKDVWIEADNGWGFVDRDELIAALEGRLIHVTELPPEPVPVAPWYRRLWWRVRYAFMGPITTEQFLAHVYKDTDVHELSMRASPVMKQLRKDE